jgi:Capsule polysaccharide biosynthesis protein
MESERAVSNEVSVEELDEFAWKVICDWPAYADFDVIHEGLDYSHLTRYFLWDKVGRAIRKKYSPDSFKFEEKLLDRAWDTANSLPPQPSFNLLKATKQTIRSICQWSSYESLRIYACSHQSPILFVPVLPLQLFKTTLATLHSQMTVVTTSRFNDVSDDYDDINPYWIKPPLAKARPNFDYAAQLHKAMLRGLHSMGVDLLDGDAKLLWNQIVEEMSHVKLVEAEVSMTRPDAILVYADNHYPVQAYVLVARREGIPSIMLQHGLDCEHYYLDEAYASAIAVWGKIRLQRYQKNSNWQPNLIQVTGNPEFDRLHLPERIDTDGEYWLWVTRPHAPNKCYLPSRHCYEGVNILKALLAALKKSPSSRLMIKPHPFDYADLYRELVDSYKLGDRVEVTNANVQSLFPRASIVISEDSTTGLEAMFFGKVVIHAHFADSPPVMPFVDYGAALPGYSPEDIWDSLQRGQLLTIIEQNNILQGQINFLRDYTGSCDGNSHQRILSFISSVLSSNLPQHQAR